MIIVIQVAFADGILQKPHILFPCVIFPMYATLLSDVLCKYVYSHLEVINIMTSVICKNGL